MNEWKALITLKLFNTKGKEAFKKLVRDEQFSKLSSRDIEDVTGINHSAVCEYRKDTESNKSVNRGRPRLFTEEDESYLLKEALSVRKEYKALTCKYLTRKCNERLSRSNRHVSRFTVSRFMRRKKWRMKHSVRKQAYCVSSVFDILYQNWKKRMQRLFKEHEKATVHIMDESGVVTNMLPRYTYVTPDEKDAYVLAANDLTKDTIVVTLSSNGNGDLFYVPFRAETAEVKGCSGVGITEMAEWADHFLSYAQEGDILIMDNLAAHKMEAAISKIRQNGIIIKFFPVRAAFKLSPLDNCFFATLKRHLEERFIELLNLKGKLLRETKFRIIKEEFIKLIQRNKGVAFYKHCGYHLLGVNLGAETIVTFGAIPFTWEENLKDRTFTVTNEIPKPQLPSVNTKNLHITFAKALSALLYVNGTYRELIAGSEASDIQELNEIFAKANGKKSFSTVSFFKQQSAGKKSIMEFIDYIHIQTNNLIVFQEASGKFEVLCSLRVASPTIPFCISPTPLTRKPKIIAIALKNRVLDIDQDLPFYLRETPTSSSLYRLTSIIGYKLNDKKYFTAYRSDNETWILYDKGWKYCTDQISDFYVDIGKGEAAVLFYEESKGDRTSLLEEIMELSNHVSKETILENMKIFPFIDDGVMYDVRIKLRPKDNIAFVHMNITGIYNPSHLCHLIVTCQALFQIKEVVHIASENDTNLTCKQLSMVFKELNAPYDEKSVNVMDLARHLELDLHTSAEMTATLKLILDKIDDHRDSRAKSVFDVFKLNDDTKNESSCIIDVDVNEEVSPQITNRLDDNDTKYTPPILLVHIGRTYNFTEEINVPNELRCTKNNASYTLYALITYSNDHYIYFYEKDSNTWIGIDDNTAFKVKASLIHWLYGWANEQITPFLEMTGRAWYVYLLLYKRSDYQINETNG